MVRSTKSEDHIFILRPNVQDLTVLEVHFLCIVYIQLEHIHKHRHAQMCISSLEQCNIFVLFMTHIKYDNACSQPAK